MQFIVYSTLGTGPEYPVLRWGDAPSAEIPNQAGSGEAAIVAPAGWPSSPNITDGGYAYNPTNGTFQFFGQPEPGPTEQENYARIVPRLVQSLRDTEWALLPDSGLTPAQVTEMVNYRAGLRAIPPTITAGNIYISWPPPPYTEF